VPPVTHKLVKFALIKRESTAPVEAPRPQKPAARRKAPPPKSGGAKS
jgi:hypothetical protein